MEVFMEYWDTISQHWPGIMFVFVITALGQTVKVRLLTKALANTSKVVFWLRRAFPLLLLSLGLITGLIWPGETSPGVSDTTHKCLYFMGCSAVSIVLYDVVKQWVKKHYDIDAGIAR